MEFFFHAFSSSLPFLGHCLYLNFELQRSDTVNKLGLYIFFSRISSYKQHQISAYYGFIITEIFPTSKIAQFS